MRRSLNDGMRQVTGQERLPEVSVVIGVKDDPEVLAGCLDALSRQEGNVSAEIIVAIEADEVMAEMIRLRHPRVTLLQLSPPQSIGELRAAGLSIARGDIVALTEAHCLPALDWLCTARYSHQVHPAPAIGGSVENMATETLVDWAAFAFEYGRFAPPATDGPVTALAAANVSYKRNALIAGRETWRRSFSEIAVHAALPALWSDPAMRVRHYDHIGLRRYLSERFHYSRWYAGERGRSLSGPRRLLHLLALPLLPLVLFTRAARRWRGKRGPYWRTLPIMVIAAAIATCGEAVGMVAGSGDSAYHLR